MSTRILRHRVPVDDQSHVIPMPPAHNSPIVHVASRTADSVDLWVWQADGASLVERRFIVVGTGQPIPPDAERYVGTAVTPGGALVWHLVELRP